MFACTFVQANSKRKNIHLRIINKLSLKISSNNSTRNCRSSLTRKYNIFFLCHHIYVYYLSFYLFRLPVRFVFHEISTESVIISYGMIHLWMVSLFYSYNDHYSECICLIYQINYLQWNIRSWRSQFRTVTIICLHLKIAEHCIIWKSKCKYGQKWNAWMNNFADSVGISNFRNARISFVLDK